MTELFNTLSKEKFKDRLEESEYKTPEEILFTYRGFVQIVSLVEFLEPPRIAHAADEKVLNAAFAAQADFIVTGDHHLLDLKHFDTIDIVTPADFLKILSVIPVDFFFNLRPQNPPEGDFRSMVPSWATLRSARR